ncbi:hypothetical protein [Bdellovibrio reynosensis]|uniref:Uncharacterized protein n=1 Tax=Bdellovibrio reynosensis TaxID=2835041 RepID=A0ABY4CC53_9BACT|nr:hypothetical protein [Bdellovibrio reynosensis]UOF02525.1 hypothetical protein MNR06_06115 [Bdellovibrio reynosensis]
MFKAAIVSSLLVLTSVTALADCGLLVSSKFKGELREVIRSELASNGVTAQFTDEVNGEEASAFLEDTPEFINEGDFVNYFGVRQGVETSPYFLSQLYSSFEEGAYNITTTTDFTFGLARLQYCKQRPEGYACKARLKEKGLVYERVIAHSTRDLIIAGGELLDLNRLKADETQIRSYIKAVSAKVCE